ncbi:MAG: neutral/alkaline non-lysosomal ceramidase N-terminal domain-containing protein [Alphaproteobacteria bacterium]|nr:neutral/alkaline non-lysosomal ceramidase N-terminal domain-containing protein [Alphaproteobacteria bacterium]
MPFDIPRPTRVDPPAGNRLRAGSARVDLTPQLGVGLGGHGPTANSAQGCFGRLFANILLIEDDDGNRVALVTADLHAGSRYLHERLGSRLAGEGLTTERIFIAGSHTHRGPSSFYGNHSYDRLAGPAWVKTNWPDHFDQATADALSDRIEAGIRAILGPAQRTADLVTLRRAKLGLAAPLLWDWLVNRSGAALDGEQTSDDPDDYQWSDPPPLDDANRRAFGLRFSDSPTPAWLGGPVPIGTPDFLPGTLGPNTPGTWQQKAPSGPLSPATPDTLEALIEDGFGRGRLGPFLDIAAVKIHSKRRKLEPDPLDRALVDARMHVLVARERRPDGRNGPLIGAFATLNATPSLLSFRHAVFCSDANGFAAQYARRKLDTPVPVGIGGGSVGDANLKPRGMNLEDVKDVGEDMDGGVRMVRRVGKALGAALFDVLDRQALAYADDLKLSFAYDDFDPVFAGCDDQGVLGGPALGGSELAASPVGDIFQEGMREKPEYQEQQAPKARLPRLESPPNPLPLRLLTMSRPSGPWWSLAACPAELSQMLSARIRDTVTQGQWPLTVTSPCGEFGSYAGTRWEYVAQAYEGAATLYGRYFGDALTTAFANLPTAAPTGVAHFTSTPGSLPLRLGAKCESKGDKPNLFSADIELHGSVLQTLRRKGKPQFERLVDGGDLVLRGSFDGEKPTVPLWDSAWVGVGLVDATHTGVTPLRLAPSGLTADDLHVTVLVWCDVRKKRNRWYIEARVPDAAAAKPTAVLVLFPPLVGGAVPRFLDATGLFDATWP